MRPRFNDLIVSMPAAQQGRGKESAHGLTGHLLKGGEEQGSTGRKHSRHVHVISRVRQGFDGSSLAGRASVER